jgi:hypothetical protein
MKATLIVLLGLLMQTLAEESPKMPKFQIVYLKWDWSVENEIEGASKLANQWSSLLQSAEIQSVMLPMGADKIIMMGGKLKKARKFILEQPEVDLYVIFYTFYTSSSCTLNGKYYYPSGRSAPLVGEDERKTLTNERAESTGSESRDPQNGDEEVVFVDEL